RAGTKPLPVSCVLLTTYREGARWRPRVLQPGRSVLEMLAHTVPAQRRPKEALAALREVALGAVTLKGARGEAEDVVTRLSERIDAVRSRRSAQAVGIGA